MGRLTRREQEIGKSMRAVGLEDHLQAEEARIDREIAAVGIERVRDELDVAINLANEDCRATLLRADKMLQRLKSDLGFPKAGLGSKPAGRT